MCGIFPVYFRFFSPFMECRVTPGAMPKTAHAPTSAELPTYQFSNLQILNPEVMFIEHYSPEL